MSMRTAEQVSEWDSVPFDDGHDGLRALADREFSGAVVSGSTQLFMLNGRVVGILDGDLDTFENAGGTARQAPHDALPLLVVMQARADEPRAQYYTEDTPISDVDRTLTDGKFTGYVELSENVLSGDYYLVYHQGRSMSVAWVGSSQRLITDEEAFEQADGEVGIYQVMPAEIEPIELPEPESDESAGTGATASDDGTADVSEGGIDAPGVDTEEEHEPTVDVGHTETDEEFTEPALEDDEFTESRLETGTRDGERSTAASGADSDDAEPTTSPSGPPGSKAAGASQGRAVDSGRSASELDPAEPQETDDRTDTAAQRSAEAETEGRTETADIDPGSADERAASGAVRSESEATRSESASSGTSQSEAGSNVTRTESPTRAESSAPQRESANPRERPADERRTPAERKSTDEPDHTTRESAEEPTQATSGSESGATAAALETRSIPSLDPGRSSSDTDTTPERPPEPTGQRGNETESTADKQHVTESAEREPATATETGSAGIGRTESAELEAELEERADQIRELESELRNLAAENDDLTAETERLTAENGELAAERDRLRDELEEARAEIRRLEEQLESAEMPATGGVQLSAREAIDGTNLFVRYHSKGGATLAKARDGNVDRDAVEENLRLEYHTQFDAGDAVVDDMEFEAFLQESIHYRFVDWLVRTLVYEIRDTGHANAMSALYGALPEVDRAELNGNVSVVYTENGQENREQEQFDVVVRDRMGNPLVVANINDSRQPATDGQMTDIVRNAERVGNSSGSLAAAFLVTSSFFEPEALETAEEATSSGLFSRDKNKSFVNLSRKDGYHLCLLEARNNEFHLAVPEL